MEGTVATLLLGKFVGCGGDGFPESFCLVNDGGKSITVDNFLNLGELCLEGRFDSSS